MTGKGLRDWPYYYLLYHKGRFFNIHHGSSNKLYADVPTSALLGLTNELIKIEQRKRRSSTFKKEAQKVIDDFNAGLAKSLGIPVNMVRVSLDKYSSWSNNSKIGLKVAIEEKEFKNFIKVRSESFRNLWKTFEYIYLCRNILTQRAVEDINFSARVAKYQERVKRQASVNLSSIEDSYSMMRLAVNKAIKRISTKTRQEIRGSNRTPVFFFHTLTYLNELRFKIQSLNNLFDIGDFSACLSEIRRTIEGFTFNMLMDQLTMRLIYRGFPYVDLENMFSEGAIKEAADLSLNTREINSKKEILNNHLLRTIVNESDFEQGKINDKHFCEIIHKNLSFASYALLYSRPASSIPKFKSLDESVIEESKLQFIDYSDQKLQSFLEEGVNEIYNAIDSEGTGLTVKQIKTAFEGPLSVEKLVVLPPSPTFSLRLLRYSILDRQIQGELYDIYNEVSPFTHSCWESSTVWPFTSVLEIMTYDHLLKKFEWAVERAVRNYEEFLGPIWNKLFS